VEGVISTQRKLVALAASAVCFLGLVLTTSSSLACTYSYDPKEVNRDFSVEITDHGRGIADLHVEVHESGVSTENSKIALDATTDDHGVASFKFARPGAYRISIKNIELSPEEEIILKGAPSTAALQKIVIQLRDSTVLSVQSVSGSIHGEVRASNPADYEVLPLADFAAEVKLTLIRARSEKIIESHMASESGAFSFSALPEGLYFLHVEAPSDVSTRRPALNGYIPIAIDPLAKTPNLNLYTLPASCVSFAYRNGDEPSS
jgi:hypothetical protein